MKPGDTVTFYTNPLDNIHPIDEVVLLEKIGDRGDLLECWWFRYLNESVIKHKGFFKKEENATNKTT